VVHDLPPTGEEMGNTTVELAVSLLVGPVSLPGEHVVGTMGRGAGSWVVWKIGWRGMFLSPTDVMVHLRQSGRERTAPGS